MFPLKVIENTALVKHLGGPPVFLDSFVKQIKLWQDTAELDIELSHQSNPLIDQNMLVRLILKGIESFELIKTRPTQDVMILVDLDIKKSGERFYLRFETIEGLTQSFHFSSFDMKPL
jgi:hypothetical protein